MRHPVGTGKEVRLSCAPTISEDCSLPSILRQSQKLFGNPPHVVCRCIPYRTVSKVGADGRSEDFVEILLITSQHGKALLFPKVSLSKFHRAT
jgi:hypothetical protein